MKEIQVGIFVQTKEELLADQKTWDDEDLSKRIDFTAYPYWLTTDDGIAPEGFDSIEDAKKSLE